MTSCRSNSGKSVVAPLVLRPEDLVQLAQPGHLFLSLRRYGEVSGQVFLAGQPLAPLVRPPLCEREVMTVGSLLEDGHDFFVETRVLSSQSLDCAGLRLVGARLILWSFAVLKFLDHFNYNQ